MSVAAPLEATQPSPALSVVGNGEAIDTSVRETPAASEDAPPPTLEQAMMASIARTAFTGEEGRIQWFDQSVLDKGNAKVQQAFGDGTRRLLIVGPDAVMFPGQSAELIQGKHVAELFDLLVMERSVVPSARYIELGFFPSSMSKASQKQTMWLARPKIRGIKDSNGASLLHEKGEKGGYQSGIEDVLIADIRLHQMYRTARYIHSLGLYRAYVLEGGRMPTVLENAEVKAARFILRSIEDPKTLTDEQSERFRELSLRAASRIDQGSRKFHHIAPPRSILSDSLHASRSLIAEQFDPLWQDRAACKGPQRALFYPPSQVERKDERETREARAKGTCALCPIQQTCLEMALANHEKDGIWGGLTEIERKRLQPKAKATS